MNFRIFERLKWKQEAGPAGADIYAYYTYKNEMLKRKYKKKNENYYIPISNVGLRENGFGMHRETKANAIHKLTRAGLIQWEKQPGESYKIVKLI